MQGRLTGESWKEHMMEIKVYQTPLAKGLPLPTRAHESDVGFDLRTAVAFTVVPGAVVSVPTGLVFNLPTGAFTFGDALPLFRIALVIEQRTGNGGKGLFPAATIVDPGYRPEPTDENGLTLRLRNVGSDILTFERGDAVAQGLFQLLFTPTLTVAPQSEILWETDRGAKRFGDTGR